MRNVRTPAIHLPLLWAYIRRHSGRVVSNNRAHKRSERNEKSYWPYNVSPSIEIPRDRQTAAAVILPHGLVFMIIFGRSSACSFVSGTRTICVLYYGRCVRTNFDCYAADEERKRNKITKRKRLSVRVTITTTKIRDVFTWRQNATTTTAADYALASDTLYSDEQNKTPHAGGDCRPKILRGAHAHAIPRFGLGAL